MSNRRKTREKRLYRQMNSKKIRNQYKAVKELEKIEDKKIDAEVMKRLEG